MNMPIKFRYGWFILFMMMAIAVGAQEIVVTPTHLDKKFAGGKYEAKVEFLTNSNQLVIAENSGTSVTGPSELGNGKFLYSAICNVADDNNFTFTFAEKGTTSQQELTLYIEEGQSYEYEITVEQPPLTIDEIKLVDARQVVPKENTAAITITCESDKLVVKSKTGEPVAGPVLNDKQVYEYTIYYDLSTEESKKSSRILELSIDNQGFKEYEAGVLSPKQGMEIAVKVLQETCFQSAINRANNLYVSGLYREAYFAMKEAIECPNKPENTATEEKKLNVMKKLYAAKLRCQESMEKATNYKGINQLDSAMHYYQDSYKFCRAILKVNSGDPYCLKAQSTYEKMKSSLPRVITGQVVNAVRMDAGFNPLPIPHAVITVAAYWVKEKKINGVRSNVAGEEIESYRQTFTADENGKFRILVPRNSLGVIYKVFFTENQFFKSGSQATEYTPTNADVQQGLVVKITPSSINKNN